MGNEDIPLSAGSLSYLKDVLALSIQERKRVHSTLDLIPLCKKGLPITALKQLQNKLQVSNLKMSELVGVSKSTLLRYYRSDGRLSEPESQIVLQLAELWSYGREVFEDEADLRTWLTSEIPALAGQTPLALLATPLGRSHVKEVLIRLDWGLYS
ncbi:MAG: antitoxin Xre/MbcA/ParS toxin-binding domain-containing protein [Bacteroidota bacterium]